ncbi:MAG: glycosyltransferase family 4 protein [Thermoanaerobaculia bacterium]
MRIGLLSYEYPPETGFGGIGTFTRTHGRALAALGHEVVVLAGAVTPDALAVDESENPAVWRLGDPAELRFAARMLGALGWWWSRNRWQNSIRMRRLLRLAREKGAFDLLEFPDCGAEGLGLNPEDAPRSVVRFHSPAALIMPFYPTRAGDRRLCALLEARSIGRAARGISCSTFLLEELRGLRLGTSALEVRVVPNGIECGEPASRAAGAFRARHGIPPSRPMILFTGRFEPRKGSELLLELVPRLLSRHELSFVVAGDDLFGIAERELLPRCSGSDAKGSLHLTGRLPIEEVREALADADVVVLPSLWESCPYAVLEAMVAGDTEGGAAIVASTAGGTPELVRDHEEALLVAPRDVDRFVAAVEELLETEALRRRLARAARKRAIEQFSPQRTAESSLAVYRTLARAGTAAG